LEPTAAEDRGLFFFTPEAAAADGDFFTAAAAFLEPTAAADGDFFTAAAVFCAAPAAGDGDFFTFFTPEAAAAERDFFTGAAAFLEPTVAEDRGWFCSRWRLLYFLLTRSSSSRWRLLHRSSSFLGTNRSRGWRRLHKSNSRGLFGSSSTGLRVLQRGASDNGISFVNSSTRLLPSTRSLRALFLGN